jgi:hypothetical protein
MEGAQFPKLPARSYFQARNALSIATVADRFTAAA